MIVELHSDRLSLSGSMVKLRGEIRLLSFVKGQLLRYQDHLYIAMAVRLHLSVVVTHFRPNSSGNGIQNRIQADNISVSRSLLCTS